MMPTTHIITRLEGKYLQMPTGCGAGVGSGSGSIGNDLSSDLGVLADIFARSASETPDGFGSSELSFMEARVIVNQGHVEVQADKSDIHEVELMMILLSKAVEYQRGECP